MQSNINEYLFSTRRLGHVICVRRSDKNDSGKLFASSYLQKNENPLSCRGSSKYDASQESRTGNPESSDVSTEEVLNFPVGSAKLVQALMGGGAFSNDDHLRTLSEWWCDRKKDQDVAYIYKLKVLVMISKDLTSTYSYDPKSHVPGWAYAILQFQVQYYMLWNFGIFMYAL